MKYPSTLSITAEVACILNICRETNPKTTFRVFSCYQSYIHFSFWTIRRAEQGGKESAWRCVQDEVRKRLKRSQCLVGSESILFVFCAPFPVIFLFLSCILKLCDYTIVPTHWILVKMKCVNHESTQNSAWSTQSCTMCYYFYWCLYI